MSLQRWTSLKEGMAPNINLTKLSYTGTDTNSVNTKQDIHSVLHFVELALETLIQFCLSSMPLCGSLRQMRKQNYAERGGVGRGGG